MNTGRYLREVSGSAAVRDETMKRYGNQTPVKGELIFRPNSQDGS